MLMPDRPTDERLLTLLLNATGDYVPGSRLQEALGVSRPAIHQTVERLGAQGIVIEARRHYGYRLVEEPAELTEVVLRAYRPLVLGCPEIVFFDSVDSTNSLAERFLAEGRETPFVVIGREQTAGRGRRGRRWHSPGGGNLYASFAFRPVRPPREMPPITLWLGLAVARAVRRVLELPVMVKWPNDLLLHGRKVAGMLTEARIDADYLRDLVFGLGLNLHADLDRWPEDVRGVATTLGEHLHPGLTPSWHRVVVEVLAEVVRAYQAYIRGEAAESLAAEWSQYDALAGRLITAQGPRGPVQGRAAGIDPSGQLRLRRENGEELLVHAGEVTIGSGPPRAD